MSPGARHRQRGAAKFSCPRPCRHKTLVRSDPRPARSWSPRSRAAAVGSTNSSPTHRNAASIAKRESCSVRKVNMTISLAFLAPDLVKAAIEGRLPHGMGVARLGDMPAEWSRQHRMLGLTAP